MSVKKSTCSLLVFVGAFIGALFYEGGVAELAISYALAFVLASAAILFLKLRANFVERYDKENKGNAVINALIICLSYSMCFCSGHCFGAVIVRFI
ncbi:MAG: hypothetical protein AB7F75_08150 [Planctomycetota bacterium]